MTKFLSGRYRCWLKSAICCVATLGRNTALSSPSGEFHSWPCVVSFEKNSSFARKTKQEWVWPAFKTFKSQSNFLQTGCGKKQILEMTLRFLKYLLHIFRISRRRWVKTNIKISIWKVSKPAITTELCMGWIYLLHFFWYRFYQLSLYTQLHLAIRRHFSLEKEELFCYSWLQNTAIF